MRRMRRDEFVTPADAREPPSRPPDFIYPVFVMEGSKQRVARPLDAGVERMTVDELVSRGRDRRRLGVPAMALFPVTPPGAEVDRRARGVESEAWPRAVRGSSSACRTWA